MFKDPSKSRRSIVEERAEKATEKNSSQINDSIEMTTTTTMLETMLETMFEMMLSFWEAIVQNKRKGIMLRWSKARRKINMPTVQTAIRGERMTGTLI